MSNNVKITDYAGRHSLPFSSPPHSATKFSRNKQEHLILQTKTQKKKKTDIFWRSNIDLKFCQVSEQFDEIRGRWSLKMKWYCLFFTLENSQHFLFGISFLKAGHLTGCTGADPHLSVKSASSEHFPHKNEKFAQH